MSTNDPGVNLSDADILKKLYRHWNISELKFIGQLVKNDAGAFFNSVLLDKKPINYPERFGSVGAYCRYAENLQEGRYYQFNCRLAPEKVRSKNPYILNVDHTKPITLIPGFELSQSSNEHFIKDIFTIRGLTPDDAARTARQLRLNELELYTQTERFIFELIQNADDMPASRHGVKIDFILTSDFFIFLHNGLSFTNDNVSAIADAGKSTKIADSQKTGYKGIGFKSVFSDAKTVYINSGGFSFRFDQDYYRDVSFETLYSSHIADLHATAKRNFLNRYKGKETEMVKIENIPWQIKPIWTSYKEYPEEIKTVTRFFREEVAIALKIGNETILNKNYDLILQNLFSEPRFLLFLRHVTNIAIYSEAIELAVDISASDNIRMISSSNKKTGESQTDSYITDAGNYSILIDNKSFENVGVPIIIFDDGEKLSFKKTDGTDLNNIPEKLARLNSTTISFAAKIENDKIVKLKDAEAILFNYLPTNDIRFGLPFLVNADFITTTNRETIIQENLWNIYLFYHIGYYAVRWIADTVANSERRNNKELRNSILALVPKLQTDVRDIHLKFNSGLTDGLSEIAFIPAAFKSDLLMASSAVLDKTGIFKKDFFQSSFKELYPDKDLISYDLLYSSEKLCKPELYGFEVTVFDRQDINRLFKLENFSPKTDYRHNTSFIRLLHKSNQVDVLKEFPSVLNRLNQLKKPNELHIYIDVEDSDLLKFDTSLEIVNPELELLASKHTDFEDVLLSDLGINRFDPVIYVQTILSSFINFNKLISAPETNAYFWRFIFKYRKSLSINDKAKLANFAVISTDLTPVPLKDCFLSSSYQTTYQIEDVAEQIGLTGLQFVNSSYLKTPKEAEEWRSMFYDCGARRSEGWELYRLNVKTLITSNKLTEANCIIITKFIFDVYRNNRSKFDLAENNVLRNLKLLTDKNGLQPSPLCFFGNIQISQILPQYDLDNLVSHQYSALLDKTSEQDWKVFLLAAGVTELVEADIVKKKFNKIIFGLATVDFNSAVRIWQFIYAYSAILTNDNACKQKLKEIPLPLLNGKLANCLKTTIYFSNAYEPKSDMEGLLGTYHSGFVSNLLIDKHEITVWRNLLTIAGVKETINAIGNGNLFEISHIEHLSNYDFALRFWSYFQKYFKVDEININSKFRISVAGQNSIPTLDGGMNRPDLVFPNLASYKEHVNDDSRIAACDFTSEVITFLGINTNLVILESDNNFLKHLGNQGEKFVYQQLKQENSLAGALFIENETGFSVGPADSPIVEVIWNNKVIISENVKTLMDSGMPYDFAIKKDGITDYIEVKTTFMGNNHFMMPESEWNCMLSNPQNYHVYRVNNMASAPKIAVRCLALDALLKGDIRPLDFPLTISI